MNELLHLGDVVITPRVPVEMLVTEHELGGRGAVCEWRLRGVHCEAWFPRAHLKLVRRVTAQPR